MELSTLTWGGIPLWQWLLIIFFAMGARAAYRQWSADRRLKKELDEAKRKFDAKYRWEPEMVNGVDCGRWWTK
jgi:hypothetical protein